MLSPFIQETTKDTEMISSFGGLDRNIQIPENCFSEMKNMSSDNYPMLSVRKPRGGTKLPEGICALQICNTYGTREDLESDEIQEDVFALIEKDSEGNAVLSFKDRDGNEVLSPVSIGGDAESTTLIAQAGYVYVFPQGYRRACYSGGDNGYLKNEIEATRIAEKDGELLRPSTVFEMSPCDSEGSTGDGARGSRRADGIYSSSDTTAARTKDKLIIVRSNGMGVNAYGCTVYVSSDGTVKEIRDWTAETINLTDNEAAYALTGHGDSRQWLITNISVGDKVQTDGDIVTVYPKDAYIVVYEKPENPANGTVWWDKATGGKYVWSSAYSEWMAYTTNYILLSYRTSGAGDISAVFEVKQNDKVQTDLQGNTTQLPFEGFKEGDCIKISGISEVCDKSYTIAAISARGLILNGTIDDIVTADLRETGSSVTIKRSVPKMDYVIECNNRLWGCYYGIGEDGKVINEIYASAPGDPTNWYRYEVIADDSWAVTVGADGPFTGAIQYGGYPLFFKENCIIRVYGSQPSSFQLAPYNYRGVAKGSHKSLAICDEVLYYLSLDGIMAYRGSVPVKVSEALGAEHYKNGVAGSIGSKYYISMLDSSDNVHLFVFDVRYGLWHEEDDLRLTQLLRHKTELYMLTDSKVITVNGDGEEIEFEAVTGEWGLSNPYRKHFENIVIRAIIPTEAELTIYSSHDAGCWKTEASFIGEGMEVLSIRIRPHKCYSLRLKFEGAGQIKILSIYREISGGGLDVR